MASVVRLVEVTPTSLDADVHDDVYLGKRRAAALDGWMHVERTSEIDVQGYVWGARTEERPINRSSVFDRDRAHVLNPWMICRIRFRPPKDVKCLLLFSRHDEVG